ncbi:hypothetical protein BU15DRAFT_82892 [Melanogaster broomeanus]|nr:hypothetical protein BU15DRAFT_82892 [Melanogaster broomeanus]
MSPLEQPGPASGSSDSPPSNRIFIAPYKEPDEYIELPYGYGQGAPINEYGEYVYDQIINYDSETSCYPSSGATSRAVSAPASSPSLPQPVMLVQQETATTPRSKVAQNVEPPNGENCTGSSRVSSEAVTRKRKFADEFVQTSIPTSRTFAEDVSNLQDVAQTRNVQSGPPLKRLRTIASTTAPETFQQLKDSCSLIAAGTRFEELVQEMGKAIEEAIERQTEILLQIRNSLVRDM